VFYAVVSVITSHNSKTTQPNFAKFLCMFPTALARSSSFGTAIRYVLPVLWMTSYFPIMGSVGHSQALRYS